jgi:hypothetical protein
MGLGVPQTVRLTRNTNPGKPDKTFGFSKL